MSDFKNNKNEFQNITQKFENGTSIIVNPQNNQVTLSLPQNNQDSHIDVHLFQTDDKQTKLAINAGGPDGLLYTEIYDTYSNMFHGSGYTRDPYGERDDESAENASDPTSFAIDFEEKDGYVNEGQEADENDPDYSSYAQPETNNGWEYTDRRPETAIIDGASVVKLKTGNDRTISYSLTDGLFQVIDDNKSNINTFSINVETGAIETIFAPNTQNPHTKPSSPAP
jgi:hypothetical protein